MPQLGRFPIMVLALQHSNLHPSNLFSSGSQGDNPFENIIRFFPNVKQLLDGVLARGGRILVHGNAGHLALFNVHVSWICGERVESIADFIIQHAKQ